MLAGCGDVEGEVEVHVVALEGLGYEAQLALLSGTDLLVGMEGQGLANMLYLPSDAAVVVLVPPGFDECAVDYTDAAALLGLAVETSLLLDAPTRSHFGPREETLEKKGYWTGAVEIVDLDLARVAEAVRRALAARARRKAAS